MKARAREVAEAFDAFRATKQAEPPSLFDAIASVTEHAGSVWQRAALEAVREAAETHDVLTVEDVAWPDDPPIYDPRARGGVMRLAAREGWIHSTQQYRPSHRPSTHRRPLLVWESLLHGGNAA